MGYTLYSRKSLINTTPLFYLKSDNPEDLNRIIVELNEYSFLKDVPIKTTGSCKRIDINFGLYSPVNYNVIHCIYTKLIEILNSYSYSQSSFSKDSLKEIIDDIELIIFSWE